LAALKELHRLAPRADIAVFADRKNAPYGTKSVWELIPLIERDVSTLRGAGCADILIACCTASTVYPLIRSEFQDRVYPIIAPTARAAVKATKTGGIAVIGTERTVALHAFGREIKSVLPDARVYEMPTQALVGMVEGGARDGNLAEVEITKIRELLSPLRKEIENENLDTLILGCTHFPHLSGVIGDLLFGIELISSAREGAREILRYADTDGDGRTVYL